MKKDFFHDVMPLVLWFELPSRGSWQPMETKRAFGLPDSVTDMFLNLFAKTLQLTRHKQLILFR